MRGSVSEACCGELWIESLLIDSHPSGFVGDWFEGPQVHRYPCPFYKTMDYSEYSHPCVTSWVTAMDQSSLDQNFRSETHGHRGRTVLCEIQVKMSNSLLVTCGPCTLRFCMWLFTWTDCVELWVLLGSHWCCVFVLKVLGKQVEGQADECGRIDPFPS